MIDWLIDWLTTEKAILDKKELFFAMKSSAYQLL